MRESAKHGGTWATDARKIAAAGAGNCSQGKNPLTPARQHHDFRYTVTTQALTSKMGADASREAGAGRRSRVANKGQTCKHAGMAGQA
jgi:hypothetical protein